MALKRDRIQPPPSVAFALEHLERRAKQDSSNRIVEDFARKAAAGEFRPAGQARAVALALATRNAPCEATSPEGFIVYSTGPIVDEDDWCQALTTCLLSLGVEVRVVTVRGESEHSWSCAVEVLDGTDWVRALMMDEASRLVRDSMEPE